MDRLDEIGAENWQDQYVDRVDGSVRCGLSILVEGEWVTKWDVGSASDIEPEKGAYSEAFKRAAVKWGVGRDLYGHAPSRPTARPNHNAAGTSSPAAGGAAGGRVAMPRPSAPTTPPVPDDWNLDDSDAGAPVASHGGAPRGPVHKWEMRPGKKGGWFCSGKLDDGSWCDQRVAA
jgi:hypothetical protein